MNKYKRKFLFYLMIFGIFSIVLLIGLTIDNIFWISASPEWDSFHTVVNSIGEWTGMVKDYTFGKLMHYVFGYRIYTVWTNWRDVGTSLMFGFLSAIGFFIVNTIRHKIWKKKRR